MNLREKDPINLIIAGVGGQGNILISKLIGQSLVEDGYLVTIGETYGTTQRGGSVASHVRISKEIQYGPLIPEGQLDVILSLEPVEALRILTAFGHPGTYVVTNERPIYPLSVAAGEEEYPRMETIKQCINDLSGNAWYVDASSIALDLGNALITNIVMTGALLGTGLLPVKKEGFERQLALNFKKEPLALNMKAFNLGWNTVTKSD
jgi:indolepyruvate ferredoxin oxidoreductase, beta subunit